MTGSRGGKIKEAIAIIVVLDLDLPVLIVDINDRFLN